MKEERQDDVEEERQDSLGSRLKFRRRYLGLSQERLARAFGRRNRWVSDIELGKRNIAITDLTQLADLLHTTVDYLVAGSRSNVNEAGDEINSLSRDSIVGQRTTMLVQPAELPNFVKLGLPVLNMTDLLNSADFKLDLNHTHESAENQDCLFAGKQDESLTLVFSKCMTPVIGDTVLVDGTGGTNPEEQAIRVLGEVVSITSLDGVDTLLIENISGQTSCQAKDVRGVVVFQITAVKRRDESST